MTGSFALGQMEEHDTQSINLRIPNYTDGVSSRKLPRIRQKQRSKFDVPNLKSLIKSKQSFVKNSIVI